MDVYVAMGVRAPLLPVPLLLPMLNACKSPPPPDTVPEVKAYK
jgi:hypothetical protein